MSYKENKRFYNGVAQSGKELFAHPVEIRSLPKVKKLKSGKEVTYHVTRLAWKTKVETPPEWAEVCQKLQQQAKESLARVHTD